MRPLIVSGAHRRARFFSGYTRGFHNAGRYLRTQILRTLRIVRTPPLAIRRNLLRTMRSDSHQLLDSGRCRPPLQHPPAETSRSSAAKVRPGGSVDGLLREAAMRISTIAAHKAQMLLFESPEAAPVVPPEEIDPPPGNRLLPWSNAGDHPALFRALKPGRPLALSAGARVLSRSRLPSQHSQLRRSGSLLL